MRKLGSGKVGAGGGKTPGGAVGVAALIVTGNPVGLIVGGGVKAYGEYSGSSKIEGRAKATAKEITDVLKKAISGRGLDRIINIPPLRVQVAMGQALRCDL